MDGLITYFATSKPKTTSAVVSKWQTVLLVPLAGPFCAHRALYQYFIIVRRDNEWLG